MITLTTQQETKLQKLWNSYKEVEIKYSYDEWAYGDVPTGSKRSKTMRFDKYYTYAQSLGFDMISILPKQMLTK